MIRFTYLFTRPDNPGEFDTYIRTRFLPLLRRLPMVMRTEVARVIGNPPGNIPVYLVADVYYRNEDEMNRSHASAEGRGIARELMAHPGIKLELFFSQIEESP